MNKLNKNVKNSLNLVWLIVTVICVIITYYCMKAKATDNYKQILQVAAEDCSLEITKLLVKDILDMHNTPNVGSKALIYSARKNCLEVMKFLITEEVNVNVIDDSTYQRTALHHATYEGHLEIVRFLLEKGANPNIKDDDGKTPRTVAVLRSRHNKDKPYDEIISLLYNAEKQMQSSVVKP
ncbi:MAG: hypothetical protein sL5_04040 [Candidatus Mesenet longicola]|uniref:Ankyrin repeat domain-containing protein n=1 Tax=Candidatus Mesenet longicola TaxID=1892558 RepID=A0A8J3HW77_9RICK|nr:MAG: hypothetical protein sGL2_02700 [Candidatus Mesenet longicola]GHM59411.1 MAG: hypothetical protein sL5_04040 [Candidatus Mesenet longicola]